MKLCCDDKNFYKCAPEHNNKLFTSTQVSYLHSASRMIKYMSLVNCLVKATFRNFNANPALSNLMDAFGICMIKFWDVSLLFLVLAAPIVNTNFQFIYFTNIS